MRDRLNQIIYIGKAKDLKKRVSSYFQPSKRLQIDQPKIRVMIGLIHDFDTVEVRSEPEALILESKLIKQWKPRFNTEQVDDKRFLMLRVDMREVLPRFQLVRFKKDQTSVYFGPFVHSNLLRQTLAELRQRYGILLDDAKPKDLGNGQWQLYNDARAEIYGHPNVVTEVDYRIWVQRACVFMEGKSREWLDELRTEMQKAAEQREFEKAAKLRDRLFAVEKTIAKNRSFIHQPQALKTANPSEVLQLLQTVLELPQLPLHIECFDISHISGEHCVASMVHFSNGQADRNRYRRYRIKSFIGNDDFRAMEEVVGRRYRRLHDEGRAFPELVVIDGGKGQVGAALKAFYSLALEPPSMIGLAKKEETIVFADERAPLQLPVRHEALKLLQRVRDEAHRFANNFNAELRSQKIKQTILDDFEGLGPVRRAALLEHFKTMSQLKAASSEELQMVEGIGPKTAKSLAAFLKEGIRNT